MDEIDPDTDAADASLTPWFEAAESPVRPGVYQRSFPAGPYTRWDGQQWLGDASTPLRAAASTLPSLTQAAPWRGLSQPPIEERGAVGDAAAAVPDDDAGAAPEGG